MENGIKEKLCKLEEYLKRLGNVAVAFSGGVDSTFLLKTAHDVLGDDAIAVTAQASYFPKREGKEAEEFCKKELIRQIRFYVDADHVEHFRDNPVNRCYYCKKAIFGQILSIAKENGIQYVVEGSNMDDNLDYRPGHRAIKELEILSPLRYAGLSKEEIRVLSKEMGLSTWEKPSFACLASRFVYGEKITGEKLNMVEEAEEFLKEKGFCQFRVRIHGSMARIEVPPEEIPLIAAKPLREELFQKLHSLGFSYVTVDLKGFRSGSMNETLEGSDLRQ